MPSLEPLLPPLSTVDRVAQTHLAWRLSAIAQANPTLRHERPEVVRDFRSLLSARSRLQILATLTEQRKLGTEVIRSRLSGGQVQGLATAALRRPDGFRYYHGRQVELSYWQVPLTDNFAFEGGKDIVRQSASYAIHLFDLDQYEDGVWMSVASEDIVLSEVCESLGLTQVGEHVQPGRLIYAGLAGFVAQSTKRPDITT